MRFSTGELNQLHCNPIYGKGSTIKVIWIFIYTVEEYLHSIKRPKEQKLEHYIIINNKKL